MSRLTELIRQAKEKDPALGAELEREYRTLSGRRAFGLNFERHRPEVVELPSRPVRRGDKVRILPPRGSTDRGEPRLWRVSRIEKAGGERLAHLGPLGGDGSEPTTIPADDLVVVAEFRDPIHPGLVPTGGVHRGGDKPAHTVINGENFHVLKALTYTHRGTVDAIYIDPPYNTGARDWKYNNDYVEGDDLYRHSKWLAFMERRLLLVKELLNPQQSVLIVTIDEKEYLRLGLLLEQLFPEGRVQMVSITINPKGTGRPTDFSRVDEFAYFVFLGSATVPALRGDGEVAEIRWRYLRRTDLESLRGNRPRQFFPIYVDVGTSEVVQVGAPLAPDEEITSVPEVPDAVPVFPVREDGVEFEWGLTGPSVEKAIAAGFFRITPGHEKQRYTFAYLTKPNIRRIEKGDLEVAGQRPDGSKIVVHPTGKRARPTTVWREKAHDAGAHGTSLLRALIPDRNFPFPKALYAVEDALRIAVGDMPEAVVVDFFAGSGTTAHAVMRLNKQDGGRRQCISVTNNEVSADEQKRLRGAGLRPGAPEWEALGICDHVTKPRIESAITGRTPDGEAIKGDYKFTDEFGMAHGFEENAEFFTLTYENPVSVGHNRAFQRVAPLLWLRAGAEGRRIDTVPEHGWDIADTYGILVDLDQAGDFAQALEKVVDVGLAYVVTDDDRRFQSVARQLRDGVEAVRLYESYLSNFRFTGSDP